MKTNFQITIGYKAVICVDVKASDEKEAKEKALELFKKQRDKMMFTNQIQLQDDTFNTHGILNMDETWNQL